MNSSSFDGSLQKNRIEGLGDQLIKTNGLGLLDELLWIFLVDPPAG